MALPTTPATWELAKQAILNHQSTVEAELKRLLGEWVSELEPVQVYDSMGMRFLGLTNKGRPTIERAFWERPMESHLVLKAWR